MVKKVITNALSWILVVGWVVAIFFLACQEDDDVPGFATMLPDYINHGVAYFVLSFLLITALQRTRQSSLTFSLVIGLVTWVALGLGMEFAQKYLTDARRFSLIDLLADGVGTILAFLALLVLSRSGDKGKRLYCLLTGSPMGGRRGRADSGGISPDCSRSE